MNLTNLISLNLILNPPQKPRNAKMGDNGESIKWPKIKLKSNLNVSYLKNHDLFTVSSSQKSSTHFIIFPNFILT